MEIARALRRRPALLLLDEPAAGLRLKEKQALADVLRQLRGEGMTILLVEHDMDFVMGLADRLVVMEFGTKLIEGTPAEVQATPGGARRLSRRRSTDMATDMAEPPARRQRPARRLRQGRGAARPDAAGRRAGSVVTVIGPNGAGKSTLLNALMGVLPSRGHASSTTASRSAGCSLEERVMRGMALVPETRELFGDDDGRGQPRARRASASARVGSKDSGAGARTASTRCSRACRSGARSSPARCRAASGRCSRSAAR